MSIITGIGSTIYTNGRKRALGSAVPIAILTDSEPEVTGLAYLGLVGITIAYVDLKSTLSGASWQAIQFGSSGAYAVTGNTKVTNLDGTANVSTDQESSTNKFMITPGNGSGTNTSNGIGRYMTMDGLRWSGHQNVQTGTGNQQGAGYLDLVDTLDKIRLVHETGVTAAGTAVYIYGDT